MYFILLATLSGFLLDPDHAAKSTVTHRYHPLGIYFSTKENLFYQIDQFKRDNEQTLKILTIQLRSLLLAFEGAISENDR